VSLAYLQCAAEGCRRRRDLRQISYQCAACGGLLEVAYDFTAASPQALRGLWAERRAGVAPADRSGVWRFRELLPFLVPGAEPVSLGEGNTPLVEAPRAGEWAGGVRLAVKHQGANPTGSFKDLGMTACISQAASQGVRVVACASTGNTSSSMAAYAARAGLRAVLFVPRDGISLAKLAQAMDFGALVVEVGSSFDEAFGLLRQLAAELGIYLVNSINPFRIEGQKAIVAEMLEQRGWRAPEFIVVPGGNLGNASAIGKALRELQSLGLLDRAPRIAIVQAAGANPFYRMLAAGGRELAPEANPQTEATAIRIGNPANWRKALAALEWSDGFCESVTDEEIGEAKAALAQDGIGCEPASAATLAGLRKLRASGKIAANADVVAVLTGNQLKDADYILRHGAEQSGEGRRLRPPATLQALRELLQSRLGRL